MKRRPQNTPGFRGTISERLYRNVAIDPTTGCFNYLRGKINGYGTIGRSGGGDNQQTHRVSWELWSGPIPDGMELHHICDNKACCNPSHLEPVTRKEHQARSPRWVGHRTHCPRGHELSPDNLVRSLFLKKGIRTCLTCAREAGRKHYAANRDEVIARTSAYAKSEKGREVARKACKAWYHRNKDVKV